jgi:signal transduction histidine kinase
LLDRAARISDHSRAVAREAIWDLRGPDTADQTPFAGQLEESLRRAWPDELGCRLHIDAADRATVLPRQPALSLLRIAQEAVTNAIKHSGCHAIRVAWHRHGGTCEMSISDDGCGLATDTLDAASRHGHFGLLGMKERATRLGAALRIESPPAGGTRGTAVRLSLPAPPDPS